MVAEPSMPINAASPDRRGILDSGRPVMRRRAATAGNLVFNGEGDGFFCAFDARNGKNCGGSTAALASTRRPFTSTVNGKQAGL